MKKLMYLAMIMLLGLAVAAKADVVIDDFESYIGPEVGDTWVPDNSAGNTSDVAIIGGNGGGQGLQITANWNNVDYSGSGTVTTDYKAVSNGKLCFDMKIEGGTWNDVKEVIVWQGGLTCDGQGGKADWAQTWLPGQVYLDGWQWMNASIIPAIVVPDGYVLHNWGDNPPVNALVINPSAGWVHVEIADAQKVDWSDSAPSGFAEDVGRVSVQVWGNGAVGPYTVDLDNVYYTPEPATIVLLGLGGLAMLRRKYSH